MLRKNTGKNIGKNKMRIIAALLLALTLIFAAYSTALL